MLPKAIILLSISNMKAAVRTGFWGSTFSFVGDNSFNKPAFDPSSDTHRRDVYIKVKAGSINPVDYKLPKFLSGKVIGIDFCGTIEAVGSDSDDASPFNVGDDVFGTSSSGSLAEYCTASIDKIAKVPKGSEDNNIDGDSGWTSLECAALPVAYMSALQSLRIGKIEPNDNAEKSVLIIGASGGCGIAGVQLCKSMEVGRIVGICSSRNSNFVKELGATEVVDYTNENELKAFFDLNKGKFDCVYDAATSSGGGEDYWSISQDILKRNDNGECCGEYVALNGPGRKWLRAFAGMQKPHESIMMMNSNRADLELIISLMDKINERPILNIVPFSDEGLRDAFELLKSRRSRGKIVFDIA